MARRLVVWGGAMRSREGKLLLAALLVLASAACARPILVSEEGVDTASEATTAVSDTTPAILAVQNNSIYDVRVYVLRAGQRYRLGLAGSGRTTTFPLGHLLINREIALYAEPVGARGQQRTETFYVRPGQEVHLQLEKRLRSHHVAVY
jgi:hypothetical protein